MSLQWSCCRVCVLIFLLVFTASCQTSAGKTDKSNHDDVNFAQKLWRSMEKKNLVGHQAIPLEPFFGGAKPHGMILEVYSNMLAVGDHTGFLVLKRNYDGVGVSVERVRKARTKYLSSITIMYQREPGYDDENLNLFWAKYKPDGHLFSKEVMGKDMRLAGRLIKGKTAETNKGCLYCHASAGGGDYIFYPEIKLPGFKYIDR